VDPATPAEIERWYPRLFRTALRLTCDADAAADLTQQTFYQALRRWDRFDGQARPTTWLHRILVNCVRDWFRRGSVRRAQPLDEWAVDALPDARPGPDAGLERSEQARAVAAAVQDLDAPTRAAFVVTVLDGYTYEQAAELLDVPVGTVASRVSRARRIVAGALRAHFPEAD
jgi:RNA polymerase sigma-70 factor (ECF subfamily)